MESEIHDAGVSNNTTLIILAWLSILLVSDLPDMAASLFGPVPSWLLPGKLVFLAVFLLVCSLWKMVRPLRPYALVMAVFFAMLSLSDVIRTSAWWAGLIDESTRSFTLAYLRPYLRDIGVTFVVILALWIVKRRRTDFFFVKGNLSAPIEPVRWLGIRSGESWKTFGWIFGLVAAAAVAFPTVFSLKPTVTEMGRIVPLLPAVILFAAINAFAEETYFRATLFSMLPGVIGRGHTHLINILFFGLAHWLYGSPPGLVGFLMTGFLAWIMGKAMVETRGFFWPWFIHFLPDVVVFLSYALLWVRG
ncbi:MAG TPA: CPBP family intramembrane metalloprotease [Thermoanaerobaculia bacterium]|nr:CPBP family intramembrane metalloprotease [Thermoanaerobaculia bacterium]HUM30026.1 CPBP family intramembrane metalloprotease [Thermoanaerobaculia bacterium]HXK68285.1 CPBP family intramembrane metalloprotease [Thermoanaerobaculia bacterium]